MHTGFLKAKLLLRSARTLKDKRQVVRSMREKLRNSFEVAVAEVDCRDEVQYIVLGVTTVAEEPRAVQSTLQHVAEALRAHPVAEFVSVEMEDLAPCFE